jgi:imidazole glycerol-phosphate synthase subunit HisF
MLNKRIIPKLLIKFLNYGEKNIPSCVTTVNFGKINLAGDPISQGKIFESQLADEIALLNFERIDLENNKEYFNFLKEFASTIFLPLSAGGGIKSLEDIEMHLKHGADKIIINTIAGQNSKFITEAAKNFGRQCIVVAIDTKLNKDKYKVYIKRGKEELDIDPITWGKKVQDYGAGEIILTDIDKDGTKTGLNINLGKALSEELDIPVILSGGCGVTEHFIESFKKTGIQGVCAGTYFSHKDQNFFEARSQMLNNNIKIR